MKHLHAIRSLCYTGASALLTVVAVLFQIGFNDPVQMVSAYFRSNLFLFVLFSVLVGTALYLWRSLYKRFPVIKRDLLFMLLTGLAVLLAFVILFLRYGGLSESLTEGAFTATNINSVLLFCLPAACLVRAAVSAAKARRTGGRIYTVAWSACLSLGAIMMILIFCGLLLHIQPFDVALVA